MPRTGICPATRISFALARRGSRIERRLSLARSGHPKRLGSFKIHRAARYADILQAPVIETHQLFARTRAVSPLGEVLSHLAPAQPATRIKGGEFLTDGTHGSLHEKFR